MAKPQKRAKEVNPKTATITSIFSNPVQYNPASKGRRNYSRLTYEELRNLARSNEIIRICINYLRREVAKVPFIFRAINPKNQASLEKYTKNLTNLLKRPNERDSARTLLSTAVEDLCVIDFAAWEKVKNVKGEIKELYAVDGSTITLNVDEYGLFKDPAYYQYLQWGGTEPDAEFERDDLMVFIQNPKIESGREGYGYSPVESIAMTALTQIQSAIYNQQFFTNDTTPPGWWNFPKAPPETIEKFSQQLEGALAGRKWKSLVTNLDGATWQSMRPSNKDMEFLELTKWLTQLTVSTFGLNPIDLGITKDVNRSNSEVQAELSQKQGISTMLDVLQHVINSELIGDLARNVDPAYGDIEFAWTTEERMDPLKQAQIDQIYVSTGILTVNEVRQRDGLEEIEEPVVEKPTEQAVSDEADKKEEPKEEPEKEVEKSHDVTKLDPMDRWLQFYMQK